LISYFNFRFQILNFKSNIIVTFVSQTISLFDFSLIKIFLNDEFLTGFIQLDVVKTTLGISQIHLYYSEELPPVLVAPRPDCPASAGTGRDLTQNIKQILFVLCFGTAGTLRVTGGATPHKSAHKIIINKPLSN
jgi:hypothetical protein